MLFGILFLVLLVPVRYSFILEKREENSPEITGKVTWLWRLIFLKASYTDQGFDYRMRILGYQILGNQTAFLEKKERKQKRREEKRKKKEKEKKKKADVPKQPEEKRKEEIPEISLPSGEPNSPKTQAKGREETEKGSEKKKRRRFSPITKGKALIGRIKGAKDKISDLMAWEEVIEPVKEILWKLLGHILPYQLNGMMVFGFPDPATTGYVTGLAAVFYPKYGEWFSLSPNFEQKIFEADCKGRGRIRMGYLLILAIMAYRDAAIKNAIKSII